MRAVVVGKVIVGKGELAVRAQRQVAKTKERAKEIFSFFPCFHRGKMFLKEKCGLSCPCCYLCVLLTLVERRWTPSSRDAGGIRLRAPPGHAGADGVVGVGELLPGRQADRRRARARVVFRGHHWTGEAEEGQIVRGGLKLNLVGNKKKTTIILKFF